MPSTRNTTAPEELDQVMTVVRPRTWLALSSVGLLLAAATAWAFLGVVTVKVTGQGILIRSGALFPIVAKTEGQLLSLTIEKGQYITKGQPVAALDQPLLRAELRETENYLGKLLVDQKQMATYERKHDELVDQFIEKQRTTLLESIR
ncbi:MAG: hypothetical protein EOM25_14370, partial [Deltaproteobacteria bacterium]|nr:hypothetical protein [Deltaproteobacteria bacterium]